MKKRLIIIALILAALLLMTFRYSIIEQEDVLPEDVRHSLARLMGIALAQTDPPAPSNAPVATPPPTPAPVPTPVPTPEPLLEAGDSGEAVRQLQKKLTSLGFAPGAADGIFGAKTEQAVIAFERHLGEMIGEQAMRAREAETAEPAHLPAPEEAQPAPAETAFPQEEIPAMPVFEGKVTEALHHLLMGGAFDEYQQLLAPGARGAEVRRLQSRLSALGYPGGRADGIFGRSTQRAVIAFQRQHKLKDDGVAGEKTQRALYSDSARRYIPPKPYLLKVSTGDQRVYAYAWSEKSGSYSNLARTMICSTGLPDTPTPKGTFTNTSPVVRWGYFPKYDVWAQYLYRIQGPYLFHSVLYEEADESTVKWGSVNKLGSPASHGCIRLKPEDARWIYANCPAGTTVTVY